MRDRASVKTIATIEKLAGGNGRDFSTLSMPFILLIFFTVWVLSPFVGFLLFDLAPKRRSVRLPAALHGVMLLLAIVSLAIYGLVALGTPGPKPAAVFLLVPLGSWVVFAIVAVIAGSRSGRG